MGKEVYLKKLFQAYYKAEAAVFPSYTDLVMREFGFIQWDLPGMTRHKAFLDLPSLAQFLQRMGPRHAYVSTTGYKYPDRPDMKDKDFQFCDFVIDIDMDHFHTPCKAEHDKWTCTKCGEKGPGEPPEACPKCQGTKFKEFNWLCETCLGASKREFQKAISVLVEDFGINPGEMGYYFSGNRGYHVHVEDKSFRHLDGESRRELTDFFSGTGLSLDALGLRSNSAGSVMSFTADTPGWGGRITRFIRDFLLTATVESIVDSTKLGRKEATALMEGSKQIRQRIEERNSNWTIKGVSIKSWREICTWAMKNLVPNIDIPVSLDVHRLIRLPNSLHGKTGFRVAGIKYEDLPGFDPFRDALVFGTQPFKVQMLGCPKFRVGDHSYGPFEAGEATELPANAAIFALCQGVADLA